MTKGNKIFLAIVIVAIVTFIGVYAYRYFYNRAHSADYAREALEEIQQMRKEKSEKDMNRAKELLEKL